MFISVTPLAYTYATYSSLLDQLFAASRAAICIGASLTCSLFINIFINILLNIFSLCIENKIIQFKFALKSNVICDLGKMAHQIRALAVLSRWGGVIWEVGKEM